MVFYLGLACNFGRRWRHTMAQLHNSTNQGEMTMQASKQSVLSSPSFVALFCRSVLWLYLQICVVGCAKLLFFLFWKGFLLFNWLVLKFWGKIASYGFISL